MALVSNELLDEIFRVASAAGLVGPDYRSGLLGGIPPDAVALIDMTTKPSLQLQADLNWCNSNERLADGTVPLRRWLENAVRFTGPLQHGPKFRELLDKATAPALPQPPTPVAPASPSVAAAARRFDVAFTFARDSRPIVEPIANRLAARIGRERVFYDNYHQAMLAVPNLDLVLQNIYHDLSDLVVVVLSAGYEEREWTGIEWRAVRDLIKRRKDRIMYLRRDDAPVQGVFGVDGYIDLRTTPPARVAELIVERLAQVRALATAAGDSPHEDDVAQLIERHRGDPDAMHRLAQFYEGRSEWAYAVRVWRRIVQNSLDANAWERLGLALFRAGHLKDADAAWKDARTFHQERGSDAAAAFESRIAAVRAHVLSGSASA